MAKRTIFVLGIGRSGTSWLTEMLSLSATPHRSIGEPFSRLYEYPFVNKSPYIPWWIPPNNPDSREMQWGRSVLAELKTDYRIIRPDLIVNTVRESSTTNASPNVVIIKEVHNLLSFPSLLHSFPCDNVVLVTRDPARVVDSMFSGHPNHHRRYLQEEIQCVRQFVRGRHCYEHGNIFNELMKKVTSENKMSSKQMQSLIVNRNSVYTYAVVVHLINEFLSRWLQNRDGAVTVSYENLCIQPLKLIQQLYTSLGLGEVCNFEEKLEKLTAANETGYYSTNKCSSRQLSKPYRILTKRQIAKIHKLTSH